MNEPTIYLQLFAEGEAPAAAAVPENDRKAALYDAFAPSLETLAKKYGIEDPEDASALDAALAREAQAQRQRRQARADRLYDAWLDQAEQTKQRYPGFDLAREMKDPRFLGLLKAQVDVGTAYEALHKQDLLPATLARTARAVEENLVRKLSQGGLRPAENGTASQGAAVTRPDVSRMSKADRQEIIRRVRQGEKIRF